MSEYSRTVDDFLSGLYYIYERCASVMDDLERGKEVGGQPDEIIEEIDAFLSVFADRAKRHKGYRSAAIDRVTPFHLILKKAKVPQILSLALSLHTLIERPHCWEFEDELRDCMDQTIDSLGQYQQRSAGALADILAALKRMRSKLNKLPLEVAASA